MQIPKPEKLPTKEDYQKVINTIVLAMTQLEPNGNCCSICGDNDHQAWECHHNPISIAYQSQHFKCFYCGHVFLSEEAAKAHFGTGELLPICAGESYKALEELLSKLPMTWYPALIAHMIRIAHQKNVFKPHGATRMARQIESKIKEGGL